MLLRFIVQFLDLCGPAYEHPSGHIYNGSRLTFVVFFALGPLLHESDFGIFRGFWVNILHFGFALLVHIKLNFGVDMVFTFEIFKIFVVGASVGLNPRHRIKPEVAFGEHRTEKPVDLHGFDANLCDDGTGCHDAAYKWRRPDYNLLWLNYIIELLLQKQARESRLGNAYSRERRIIPFGLRQRDHGLRT